MGSGKAPTVRRSRDENTISPPVHIAGVRAAQAALASPGN
jgi:hypothetical protein